MNTEEKQYATLTVLAKKAASVGTAPDPKKICAEYKKLRPLMLAVLPFIEKIPLYGKKIGDVIRLLMSMADNCCQGSIKTKAK